MRKLFNIFSTRISTRMRKFLCTSFFLIALIGVYFCVANKDSNAFYYLFSSITQSLVALVAVVGTAGIFKMQQTATTNDRLAGEICTLMVIFIPNLDAYDSYQQLIEAVENKHKGLMEELRGARSEIYENVNIAFKKAGKIKQGLDDISKARCHLVDFAFLSLITAAISAISILLVPLLIQSIILSISVSIIVIAMFVISLWLCILSVKAMVGYSYELTIG